MMHTDPNASFVDYFVKLEDDVKLLVVPLHTHPSDLTFPMVIPIQIRVFVDITPG